MKIYTHQTKNDLTAWASIRLGGAVLTFLPPGKFSLRGPDTNTLHCSLLHAKLQTKLVGPHGPPDVSQTIALDLR